MRLLLLCGMTAILTLAVAAGLGYQPPNARADGPQRCEDQEHLVGIVEGCAKGLGRFEAKLQGGVIVGSCAPSLGVAPVRRPTQRRQVAIRSPQGREAEDLVGPHTPTNRNRPGAPNGSPGRAGAGVEGDQP